MVPKSEVINGDCMDYLPNYPDNYFQLACVDPPYGIGNFIQKDARSNSDFDKPKWNDKIPNNEYFKEIFRVSKNQIIWGGNYYTKILKPTNYWIIWDKKCECFKAHQSRCEMAWTSYHVPCNLIDSIPWTSGFMRRNIENIIHPCQKPIALYKYLLKNYAKPGDTILDTHLGSGSSRIAAHEMGFDFEGYEIDKDYFDAQEKRFQNHIKQQSLFQPNEMYT